MNQIRSFALLCALSILSAPLYPEAVAGGDGGKAQKAAAAVFRENPTQADPVLELARLRNEGIALYESGIALDDALSAFERAFERSDTAPDAFNIAAVYFRKNDLDTTKSWLEKALERDPTFPNAHYLLGVLAKSKGDLPTAKRLWLRTRELAPDDGHLHYQLALIARSERDNDAFLQSLVHALSLEPDNTAALYQMSRYYQTSGNREMAKEIWGRFNAIKKQEKFSRREKTKDPSRLSRPVLARADGAAGFAPIEVAPAFTRTLLDPGCAAVSADRYVRLGEAAEEHLALACKNGRLLRLEADSRFQSIGRVPTGTTAIRLEWLDDAGARVLALTDTGLHLANTPVETSTDYTVLPSGAAAPLALADLDADGDVDIATGGGRIPLTNASQLELIEEKKLYADGKLGAALDGATAVAVADLQRNGLADLVILRADRLLIWTGSANGPQQAMQLETGSVRSAVGVADLDNDGRLDLILAGDQGLRLIWSPDPGKNAAPPRIEDLPQPGASLQPTDYNNDGLLDLALLGADGTLRILRNHGEGHLSAPTELAAAAPATGARLIPLDPDGDGREDLAYVTRDGKLALLRNTTAGVGNTISLFANGVRAAPSGLLTRVEVRRGGRYTYAQSAGAMLRLGIGASDYVEILRLEWTNGFIENKLKIDARAEPYVFEESERISGSCPSLFVWDGERFEYLTDAFISGPMGVPLDRGIYFPVKDRELLLIPGDRAKLRDGRLDLRFTEELHETVFIDRARLLVVDHPEGTEVLPHSRLAPVPPIAAPFYTAAEIVSAASATSSDGTDLTETLATTDGAHADFFARSAHAGFAEPHWIELTLPEAIEPSRVDALLATGWFFYFESTSMIAEAQRSGPNLPWPTLQQFVDGAWRNVGPIGVPSGKGKTAVVPLAGKLRSRRLRVSSGISVYWDRLAFSLKQAPAPSPREATLAESSLRFHGFSSLIAHDPERFDYQQVRYGSLWSPMRGRFTAYGPAEGLISVADGRYAVFGSGDELAMSFEIDEPAPAAGMSRSYLIEFVGYVKDGDRYTAHAGQVEPMPYLGLDQYPAPDDERLRAAQGATPFRTRAPLDFTLTRITAEKDDR